MRDSACRSRRLSPGWTRSTAFRVSIQPRALLDIEEATQLIEQDAPTRAERWYRSIRQEIAALEEMPLSHALIPESEELGFELRQFHYHAHRVIFRVKDDAVEVLRVYHGARQALNLNELPA